MTFHQSNRFRFWDERMKLNMMKTGCCLMLVIASSLLVAVNRSDAKDQEKEKPKPAVAGSTIDVSECRIKLIDRVILGSDRPGVLEFVEPNEGEQVKKGQVVAALKSDALKASRKTAEVRATNDIEIRYSQKAKETSYAELEMSRDANRRNYKTISKLEIMRLVLTAEKSDLQVEQAELEFEMNKMQLAEIDAQIEETKVIAPFDGFVTKKFRSTG